MKPTEIEAERAVSTSGLLTGKAYSHLTSTVEGKHGTPALVHQRQAPRRSCPAFQHLHSRHLPLWSAAFTVHNATPTQTFEHPLICSKQGSVQSRTRPQPSGKGPQPEPWLCARAIRQRWPRSLASSQDSDLKIKPASLVETRLCRSLGLYQIIKPISHRAINGRQGRFLKKWLFCHHLLDSAHHMTNN